MAIFDGGIFDSGIFDTGGGSTVESSFSASAVVRRSSSGSFGVSAVVQRTFAAAFSLDASITIQRSGSFSISSLASRTVNPTFTLSSNVGTPSTTYEFAFGASALVRGSRSGTFGLSAIVKKTITSSKAIDAVVRVPTYGSFALSSNILRVVADSFSLSAMVGWGFGSSAIIKKTIAGSFGISARVRGPEYVVPQTGDKIVIAVDEVDLTESIIFSRTEFVAQVNGVTGTCRIVIVDRDRSLSFTVGQRIYVTVNNLRIWTGYIARVKRIYPFEAHSPQDRLIEIEGVDINVLFSKRIVYNKTNPLDSEGPTYPAHTDDTTALHDLFYHYLDLSEDDLNLSAKVSHVGTINEDQPSNEIVPSSTWADSMRLIGSILSPIWYINPDRQVVWADVDIEDAPFDLSDNPSGAEVGVASLTIYRDASSMINDVLLLGAGNGSAEPVYKHLASNSSIAEHGLFQYGNFVGGVWKQATIDRIASSYINGSPSSKRGHKEDRISATCTVYQHGLRAGNKVHLTSDVWGFDDIIPIRQLRLRWISPDQPKYELTLSHELDTTWNLFDPTPLKLPKRIPPVDLPPRVPPPKPGGCNEEICGITDTFTRTVANGWGTSDAGIAWDALTESGVDGSRGWIEATSHSVKQHQMDIAGGGGTISFSGVFVPWQATSDALAGVSFWVLGTDGHDVLMFLGMDGNLVVNDYYASSTTSTSAGFTPDVTHNWKIEITAGGAFSVKVWEAAESEPVSWTKTLTGITGMYGALTAVLPGTAGEVGGTSKAYFDNLDISGVNRCTEYRFDNFNRTVAAGWGTSSSGVAWSGDDTNVFVADDIGSLIVTGPFNEGTRYEYMNPSYLQPPGSFTMTARVRFFNIPTDGWASQWRFVAYGGAAGYVELIIDIDASGSESSGISVDGSTYEWATIDDAVSGQWYLVKWEHQYRVLSRAKIWADGTAEPAWLVTRDATGDGTGGNGGCEFRYELGWGNKTGKTSQMDVDYIDFDYDGKPCYQTIDCIPSVTDNFARDIDGHWGGSWIDPGPGYSASGFVWVASASGGVGYLFENSENSPETWDSEQGLPLGASISPVWEATFSFTPTAEPVHGYYTLNVYASELYGVNSVGFAEWLALSFYNEPSGLAIGFGAIGSSTMGWGADTWSGDTGQYVPSWDGTLINVRWRIDNGGTYAKIWAVGDSEPAIWGATMAASISTTTYQYLVFQIYDGTLAIETLSLMNNCITVGPAVGSSAPTSGYYCEHIPYIGAPTFFTSVPYTPGTLRVSVDGLRQAGFTETIPTTGAFTANYDLTGSHDLWVCYLVASTA